MFLWYIHIDTLYCIKPRLPVSGAPSQGAKLLAVSSSARLLADEDRGPGCCMGNSQTRLVGFDWKDIGKSWGTMGQNKMDKPSINGGFDGTHQRNV